MTLAYSVSWASNNLVRHFPSQGLLLFFAEFFFANKIGAYTVVETTLINHFSRIFSDIVLLWDTFFTFLQHAAAFHAMWGFIR